jgi:transposase-like protein
MEAMCPACGEGRLVEWDPFTRHWFCSVCAKTWRRSVEGEARRLGRIRTVRWPATKLDR